MTAAVLQGVVVEDRTSKPVSGAEVVAEAEGWQSRSAPHRTVSGPKGRFEFPALPAGAYRLTARKKGYAESAYGQKGWQQPGTPVFVAGDARFTAEIRLKRLGVVTGQVNDDNEVGIAGLAIHAYREGRPLKLEAVSQTDDRGIYRLAGLPPGRYYIQTAALPSEDGRDRLPTWFGQATSARQSRPVLVSLDEEIAGIDLTPLEGKLGSLTGTITGAAQSVTLLSETGKREAAVREGRFRFDHLAPASYELIAEAQTSAGLRAAYQAVRLIQSETAVALQMAAAPEVQLACQQSHSRQAAPANLAVFGFLRRRGYPDSPAVRLDCGGKSVLGPGEWEFTLLAPSHLYIASVLGASREEEAYLAVLTPGQNHELVAVLSAAPAVLLGTVKTARGDPAIGAPVYLRALEGDVGGRLGGLKRSRTDEKGAYRFDGLPPGRYEVLSSYLPESDNRQAWPPEWARNLLVVEGERREIDLTLQELP